MGRYLGGLKSLGDFGGVKNGAAGRWFCGILTGCFFSLCFQIAGLN
ncbi:hypothetical protein ADIS_0205 [Lunatimonas lonarensis]|uniref:Uncharacterized protein n=1 Tax=Lunatimonas lonarensis TaxID=1232681 RepID=R7ZYW3_9BACT|nr:hypothetical protein ADIS_0205 [Lunatimonas lonarensis]